MYVLVPLRHYIVLLSTLQVAVCFTKRLQFYQTSPVICHYTITLVRLSIQRSMCILSARTCTTRQYLCAVQDPPAVRDNIRVLYVQMATRNTYVYSAGHLDAVRANIHAQHAPVSTCSACQ